MRIFDKPPLSTDEHYELLSKRSLIIENKENFYKYITNIGYFRLSEYMRHFIVTNNDEIEFIPNTKFSDIISLYIFDKKLRNIVRLELERIEISLKANISNTMSLKFGSHWYLNEECFIDKNIHYSFLEKVKENMNEHSNESYIRMYKSNYDEPSLPPSWIMMEMITFTTLSKLFSNLKDNDEKKIISSKYEQVDSILSSWLTSFAIIRNLCAHHARLWNKNLMIKPIIPRRKKNRFLEIVEDGYETKMYGILCCMNFLVKKISPNSKFKERVKNLFEEYPKIDINNMGFPPHWKEEEIWK